MTFVGDRTVLDDVKRGLSYMRDNFIQEYTSPDGKSLAFLIDTSLNEIKLGGNGLALLALAKYRELSDDDAFDAVMPLLAEGIAYLQETDGSFIHALDPSTLAIKDTYRTVYYDGEAIFGLMRLYGLDSNERWLAIAKKSFDYFLGSKSHIAAHDHWMSYAVNELCAHAPEEKYFRFGFTNCIEHLDYILKRETSAPTLLELMMAAQQLVLQAEKSNMSNRVEELDMEKFCRALPYRARRQLDGFFWPEVAMFFANPNRVIGSFFGRYEAFRTRIDDQQHCLSGLAAYGAMLETGEERWAAPDTESSATNAIRVVDTDKQSGPRISVIIPTYNRAQFITRCLDAIAESSLPQELFEVICVDDCSTDNTRTILESYKKIKHFRIIFRSMNSGGASEPRNDGIKAAQGEYLLFIDSDDYIGADLLHDLLAMAEKNNADMVCAPYWTESGRATSKHAFTNFPRDTVDFFKSKLIFYIKALGKLVRKSLIEKYAIFFPQGIKYREDNEFVMKCYAVSKTISTLSNEIKYYYIEDRNDVSLTNYSQKNRKDVIPVLISTIKFIFFLPEMTIEKKSTLSVLFLNRLNKYVGSNKQDLLKLNEALMPFLQCMKGNPLSQSDSFIDAIINSKLIQ
jgi:glycosyltransferase involved in cell wall biosynthesis